MKLGNHSGKCSGHDDDLYTSFSLPTFLQFFTLMERERLLTRADRQKFVLCSNLHSSRRANRIE